MPAKQDLQLAGSLNDDIRGSQRRFGFNCRMFSSAQEGKRHPDAWPAEGIWRRVGIKVVLDRDGDTCRGVYFARFPGPVYVLAPLLQKKSKTGVQTPKSDMDLIGVRTKGIGTAQQIDAFRIRGGLAMKRGRGNVFADVGLPDSEALPAKAELTCKIADIIEALDLTQSQVA